MHLSQPSGALPIRSGLGSFPLSTAMGVTNPGVGHQSPPIPRPLDAEPDPHAGGDGTAANDLFQRHYSQLLRYANSLCPYASDAEDVCQSACFKASRQFPLLRNAEVFCPWVEAFISNEASNFRKKSQKVGTATRSLDTYLIQTMSAEADKTSEAGVGELLGVLRERAATLPLSCRQTAAAMLDGFARCHEFPNVRAIASVTHCSQGTAQRSCAAVLVHWRRMLSKLSLHP